MLQERNKIFTQDMQNIFGEIFNVLKDFIFKLKGFSSHKNDVIINLFVIIYKTLVSFLAKNLSLLLKWAQEDKKNHVTSSYRN